MIFSELYSAYFNAVAAILSMLLDGETDEKKLQAAVAQHAFGESALTILPALKNEQWQLMRRDMTTPLTHRPTMPLTDLQKRWLKAISLDPRVKLFGVQLDGLADVEPLFTAEDYRIYDQYGDGDPFADEAYIRRFRFLLSAIRQKTLICAAMVNRAGKEISVICLPLRLEYSEKDDKFRLITMGSPLARVMNLARITACEKYTGRSVLLSGGPGPQYDTLTLKIRNNRNALERCMLHFAHFEKQAERTGADSYLVRIRYNRDDETEMVIRILSFGPLVEVTEPESFRNLIRERLLRQKNCGLK